MRARFSGAGYRAIELLVNFLDRTFLMLTGRNRVFAGLSTVGRHTRASWLPAASCHAVCNIKRSRVMLVFHSLPLFLARERVDSERVCLEMRLKSSTPSA